MYTLGINAAFHDSAACLVRDGEVVAAAEEERFNRIKHGKRPVPFSAWELPFGAIDYCLQAAGIRLVDVAHVAYSFDPALMPGHRASDRITLPTEPSREWTSSRTEEHGPWASPWEPLFHAYMLNAPRQLTGGAPHHLRARFRGATPDDSFRWHFVEHHLAHEASAFLAAPFEGGDDRTAVMTLDGRGERATSTLAVWRDGTLTRLREIDFPHSLGLLYEDVTRHLGFLHSSDEYKVMALASYGRPAYRDFFRERVMLDGDGGYLVEPNAGEWLMKRFGPPRERGARIEQRHFDLAASLQCVLEEVTLGLARWLRERSGEPRLCMAGGVALNCVMNARLRDSGIFDDLWVQPAAGDAGTALGAALWIDRQQRGESSWRMHDAYLGPAFDDAEIERALLWAKLPYRRLRDVVGTTSDLLANNRIVGWFQGRMEFGPRALGSRSILASPLDAEMQFRLNDLKDREDFRPVAPVVPEEVAGEWFVRCDGQAAGAAPFMLFVFKVQPERAARIPAAVHVDGTARVQTVSARANPRYHALLHAFGARTGVPVLINTSFNVRGEPIVCTPRDAIAAFCATPLDALVIGSFLLEKQP
jgi:carbamoyltransferase